LNSKNNIECTFDNGGKMKNLIIILLIAAMVTGCTGTAAPEELSFSEQMDLGYKYIEEGKYEESILAFQNAITIDEKSIEARIGLAEAYVGIEDLLKAEEVIKEAINIEGNNTELKKRLIGIYEKSGDKEKIEEAFNMKIQMSIMDKDYESAEMLIREALVNDMDNTALWNMLISVCKEMGKDEEEIYNLYLEAFENTQDERYQIWISEHTTTEPAEDYFSYTFKDILNEFGTDYVSFYYEGGEFIKYDDSRIPYIFGFMQLRDENHVLTIYLDEYKGTNVGMLNDEVIEVLGEPISQGSYLEEGIEWFLYYEIGEYSISYSSKDNLVNTIRLSKIK
jgi:Tfp pilus assembly protein PilF